MGSSFKEVARSSLGPLGLKDGPFPLWTLTCYSWTKFTAETIMSVVEDIISRQSPGKGRLFRIGLTRRGSGGHPFWCDDTPFEEDIRSNPEILKYLVAQLSIKTHDDYSMLNQIQVSFFEYKNEKIYDFGNAKLSDKRVDEAIREDAGEPKAVSSETTAQTPRGNETDNERQDVSTNQQTTEEDMNYQQMKEIEIAKIEAKEKSSEVVSSPTLIAAQETAIQKLERARRNARIKEAVNAP